MEIISRKEAIEKNLDFYFTSIPCKSGHISKRYTKHRSCFMCLKEKNNQKKDYMKQYRKNNRQKIKDLFTKWFEENKADYYKYQRKYRELYKESVRANSAKRMREYRKRNPEKVREKELIRRNIEGKSTHKDIKYIIEKQGYRCAFCLLKVGNNFHVDHIIPVKLGGTNWPKNLQILCPTCNLRKNAKHPIDWANENGLLC